jgi:ribonuclease D
MTVRRPSERDLPDLLAQLGGAERVAVDTEFHAERRYWPELFLVQVQVPGADAWILDPLKGELEAAGEALVSVPWLVHGGSQDLRLLQRALGTVPDDVYDTQIGSALCGERYPQGYGTLVSEHLGLQLPKASTLSDWSRRPLSDEQIAYAIDDVARLPALWAAIEAKLVALDRLDTARQACAEFRADSIADVQPREAWRSIHASAGMNGAQRSVLRELCAWREQTALDSNVPPRAIVNDGVAIELSKRPPATRERLLANRRFPRHAKRYVDDLLGCIERGLASAPDEHPRCVERHTAPWRLAATLRAWALIEGHRQRWAPRWVLPDDRIDRLALARPADRSALADELGPWRDALLGDDLWALLTGEGLLRVSDGQAHVAARATL